MPRSISVWAATLAALGLLFFCYREVSAETVVTVAPSVRTGLFKDVGPLSPHAYRPNEFFSNDWVFEGLVRYGRGGEILPALAESWSERSNGAGMTIAFKLRQGVKFHDGTPWNASVAVANFEDVLHPALNHDDYHGWYDLPSRITAWRAVDTYILELDLDMAYYPIMQELTYIRPLRMLSMNQMRDENTCPPAWGTVTHPTNVSFAVKCTGHVAPSGTGAYMFDKKITTQRVITPSQVADATLNDSERVLEVHFVANPNYWGGAPAIDRLVVRAYETHDAVMGALRDGSLDIAYGSGTLKPQEFRAVTGSNSSLTGLISPPINTRLIALNSGRGPTSSLAVRKAIIHSVNKAAIVRKEMEDVERVAHTVFSRDIPYSNIDLFPVLDYDPEKSRMLLEAEGWVVPAGKTIREKDGMPLSLEFIFIEGDPIKAALEDDVRADLAKMGISVQAVPVKTYEEWIELAVAGEFHLSFSETWGPPYDPHSFVYNWRVPERMGDYVTQLGLRNDDPNLAYPMNKTELDDRIAKVLRNNNPEKRAEEWRAILTAVHEQAIYLPISFKTNMAVVSSRIENFEFGVSEYDIPAHQLRVAGQPTVVVEAGSSGLSAGAIAGICIACVIAVVAVATVAFLVVRERRGKPVFVPLITEGELHAGA